MKGTCEVCGTREIELQENNAEGQLKMSVIIVPKTDLLFYECVVSYQA